MSLININAFPTNSMAPLLIPHSTIPGLFLEKSKQKGRKGTNQAGKGLMKDPCERAKPASNKCHPKLGKSTFHPEVQKVSSHVHSCERRHYAGPLGNTNAEKENQEDLLFRASLSENIAALDPLLKNSDHYKYWVVAKERRKLSKASRKKASDAQIKQKKNMEELEVWWISHFGSAKLLISTDHSKSSASFVEVKNTAKSHIVIKKPQAFSDSWSKSVEPIQPCHLSKGEGKIDKKPVYPKINQTNETGNTRGDIKNPSKIEVTH